MFGMSVISEMLNRMFSLNTVSMVAIGAAVVLFAIYYIRRGIQKKNGPVEVVEKKPENGAVKQMRAFARKSSFAFIAPAPMKRGDKTAKLDAVVVGYFGVLGVISLEYSGTVYGGAKESRWVAVDGAGERTEFANPVDEASAAVRVLRDALNAGGQKRVPVEVLAVFTDDTAVIAVPRSTTYHTTKTLKDLLRKEKYMEDAGLDIPAVEAALLAAKETAEEAAKAAAQTEKAAKEAAEAAAAEESAAAPREPETDATKAEEAEQTPENAPAVPGQDADEA